jgi:hypothetical protein
MKKTDMRLHGAVLILGILALFAPCLQGQQTRRDEVLDAMRQRNTDPWPRGEGHVVLAGVGSYPGLKGYHEPGGSFSPELGSFGVSVWLQDSSGAIKATSDSLPADQIIQRFSWGDPRGGPGIYTDTPYYWALWTLTGQGLWKLDFQVKTNAGLKTSLVIRGVGPAAGPVNLLTWSAGALMVNRRWNIRPSPAPEACQLVTEGPTGWLLDAGTNTALTEKQGWGCARLALADGKRYSVAIRDTITLPAPVLAAPSLRAPLEFSLPDTNFTACLQAQVTHLLMGLAAREPRACEPSQAAQTWMREAAQTTVALAQAGQVEVARQLCVQLAEQDFLGGFGPEADNPGLALWALAETSLRLRLPQFDQFIFPQVARKAKLIMDMRVTEKSLFKTVTAPVDPAQVHHPDLTLLCDPARDGLIRGKVAWGRPLFYVNAVSFRGLLGAAEIADRVGDTLNAGLWRSHAADIRREWIRLYANGDPAEDFTTKFALWPAQIVYDRNAYMKTLLTRWEAGHDAQGRLSAFPSQGSQTLAEAHQWLYLNQAERVWSTLIDFWGKQSSPGLFTWGETPGPASSSPAWKQVRGWVNPPEATPHYGIAAQMLMLQLDMLAGVDESGSEPVLVIGPGVPIDWIHHPLLVRGLATRIGWVQWHWTGGAMQVLIRGTRCRVVLGSTFPANAPVRIL